MSKTADTFLSLMNSNTPDEFKNNPSTPPSTEAPAPVSAPEQLEPQPGTPADSPDSPPSWTRYYDEAQSAAAPPSHQTPPQYTQAPAYAEPRSPERRPMGRPSSFAPGEPAIRRNYRISEIDDQALKIYLGTAEERDLSQVVRNAIRAYIPSDIYKTAEMIVNLQHSARH